MSISAAVTIVDKLGDGEEDWGHGEEVVVWSNGRERPQDSNGEALGSFTTAVDVEQPPVGRDSHPRALLIASLANLGISYNVVNIDLVARIMRDLYSEDIAGESLVKAAAIFGMMAGQVIFGTLGDVVGRQLALCCTLLVCFLGAVGSASIFGAGIFHQLVFWRLVLGIGAGGVYPLAAILARASGVRLFPNKVCGGGKGEDDEDTGGTAVAFMFSMQGVGHLTARVTGYVLVSLLPNNMEIAWRLLLGLGAVLPLVLAAAIVSSARDTQYDLMRDGEGREEGRREAPPSGGTIDGPHSTSLMRMWMALPDKERLIPKLIGTAGSWFLFDVTFYGNQLYQGDVLEGVFGAAETAKAEAAQHTVLEMVGLPGYFVTVALVGSMGPRRIQIQGFTVCAILFGVLGLAFEPLKKQPFMLLGLYSFTFFFANFGPNSTTFMLPSLTFPDQVCGSLNGISAASGKLGAFVGSLFFRAAVTILEGVGPVLIICALFSLAGGALTMAFVHPEDDEPTAVVAGQDTNEDDQDYLELAREERGGSGLSRSSSVGNSPTLDEPSREHTPINVTNRRVEGAAEVGKEYGGFHQAGIGVVLNSNGILYESVKGHRSVVISEVDGVKGQVNQVGTSASEVAV